MAEEVARFSPRDQGGFERFIDDNRSKLARFRPLLERGFGSWTDLVGLDTLRMLPHLRPRLSLDQELARHFDDPRLRLAFAFQSKYLGMSPFSCPSAFSIISFIEYEYGLFHVTGGLGQVSVAMARVAEQLGARIHLNTPVEEVLYEGERAVGVRLGSGERHADAVVVNGDFARAMQRIVPEDKRPSWDDVRIEQSGYSCSTFMLYLGVEGRFDELEHHTVYVAEDYRRNMSRIENGELLGEDFSLYVQNASVTDPTLAPEGHSTLYVLVPTANLRGDIDWDTERGPLRDRVIRQLQKLGITDLERRIRYERVVTPADWSQQYEVHLGAVFNLAHSLDQMMTMRPGNRFDDGLGLYIVGGGTHPGSGLPVIYEGARIAAKALLEDLPKLEPVVGGDVHDASLVVMTDSRLAGAAGQDLRAAARSSSQSAAFGLAAQTSRGRGPAESRRVLRALSSSSNIKPKPLGMETLTTPEHLTTEPPGRTSRTLTRPFFSSSASA